MKAASVKQQGRCLHWQEVWFLDQVIVISQLAYYDFYLLGCDRYAFYFGMLNG